MTEPTTAALCPISGCRRHPTRGLICRGHADKAGQMLADIEQLYATLETVPSQVVDLNHAHGSVLASHRSPARMDALVLRDRRSRARDDEDRDGTNGLGVLEVLASWASLVREERGLTPATATHTTLGTQVPIPATVTSERNLLAAHLDWCLDQPWVDEMYADLRQLWALLKAAHGEQAPRPAARCWVPLPDAEDGALCGGPIWSDPGMAWCGTCRTRWTGLELLRISTVLTEGAA